MKSPRLVSELGRYGERRLGRTYAWLCKKTASQIVLRWIVQRDLITIPRAKPNHFKENLDIMAFSLFDDDMQAISALNQNLRSNALNDPETFPW